MSPYQLQNGLLAVKRVADGLVIPVDPANPDWQAYQQFLSEGGRPDPPPSLPAPVPEEVKAGQLIRALDQLGMLATIDAAAAKADALTQRLWARGSTFPRNDPLLLTFTQGLNMTPDQIDDIFRLAATK